MSQPPDAYFASSRQSRGYSMPQQIVDRWNMRREILFRQQRGALVRDIKYRADCDRVLIWDQASTLHSVPALPARDRPPLRMQSQDCSGDLDLSAAAPLPDENSRLLPDYAQTSTDRYPDY